MALCPQRSKVFMIPKKNSISSAFLIKGVDHGVQSGVESRAMTNTQKHKGPDSGCERHPVVTKQQKLVVRHNSFVCSVCVRDEDDSWQITSDTKFSDADDEVGNMWYARYVTSMDAG